MENYFKRFFGKAGSSASSHDWHFLIEILLKAAIYFKTRLKTGEAVAMTRAELPGRRRTKHVQRRWLWALAGTTVFLAALLIFIYTLPVKKPGQAQVQEHHALPRCIPPGNSQVVLTLSDGRTVQPDQHPPGLLRQEGDMKLVLGSGSLSYLPVLRDHPSDTLRHNSLFVPKGRLYEVVLSDGTKVWVNSDTRLRYPVAFSSSLREVEVTGEAYFEVAPDASRPFLVKANGLLVDVLGTSFNISNYPDEKNIRFSLTSGEVMLSSKEKYHRLNMGQRVELNKDSGDFSDLPADVDEDLGWMEGEFRFRGTDVDVILRQLARWYDLKLVLKGPGGVHSFNCKFSRAQTLPEALQDLSNMYPGLHYRLEGKNLVVVR